MINRLLKNIIIFVGILCCLIIFILNIIYVSSIKDTIEETVFIQKNKISTLAIVGILVIAIILINKKIEELKLSKTTKLTAMVIFVIIYGTIQVFWINIRQAIPSWDQWEVYLIGKTISENRWEELLKYQYLEKCPQQITTSIVFASIFKLFSSSNIKMLQYINVFSNVLTIIGIILISNILGRQYKVNKSKALILISTFFSLQLLSTFVYGDIMSIPMCLLAIYFIMKYGKYNKKKHIIISALFMAVGYALRMNNLIFIIALVIYLIFNILKKYEEKKQIKIQEIMLLFAFIIITIMPTEIIKDLTQHKLDLDCDKQIPISAYLYIGMQESSRANGWYSDYMVWAWEDAETSDKQYKNAIIERIKYFVQNPKYFINFYIKKITSMWTENTYASIWYNQTFNFKKIEDETQEVKAQQLDKNITKQTDRLLIYQKAIVIVIFGTTILVLIKYRKKLSNEIILLITIFVGGFLFHILWEAKSRYIIPYIIVLIPVASISFDNGKGEVKDEKNQCNNTGI